MATQSSDYTYASAQAATIPAAVGIVQLQDRNHSFWQRASTQPSHAGKFRSQDRFLPNGSTDATHGGYWELMRDQVITPFLFGAVGNGSTNDSVAMQAFFDFCELFRLAQVNWDGRFALETGLTVGGTYGDDQSSDNAAVYEGRMELVATAAIGNVLTIQTRRNTQFGPIAIGPNAEQYSWTSRIFNNGIVVRDQAQMCHFAALEIAFAKNYGILFQTRTGIADNIFGNEVGPSFFYGCGSGASAGNWNFFQSSTYTIGARSGQTASPYQSQRVAVATLPANEDIANTGDGGTRLTHVYIDGKMYDVVDQDTGYIDVSPWIPASAAATGTLYYAFGGGVGIIGGDAGRTNLRGILVNACGFGVANCALYPGNVEATMHECATGYRVGGGIGSAVVGGEASLYMEGCIEDMRVSMTSERAYGHTVRCDYALAISKIRFNTAIAINAAQPTVEIIDYSWMPQSFQINYRGKWIRNEQPRATLDENGGSYIDGGRNWFGRAWFDRPYGEAIPLDSNSPRIDIQAPTLEDGTTNEHFFKFFNYQCRQFHLIGTGSNGEPTGTLTVNPPNGTATINGGTAGAAFTASGFTGPVIVIVQRIAVNSWNVRLIRSGASVADGDKGDITVSGSGAAWSIDNDSVTNAKLANMAQATIKGRANGVGTGDPQDLTPAQARAVIASDSNNGGLFLAGDGTFKAAPGGTWTVDYTSNRASWYNLTPANLTHVVFNTSDSGYHYVYLQNVANGTRVKLSRLRGGQAVTVVTSDQGQTVSRTTGTGSNPTIADGGTVFLTKIGTHLWVGEGDFVL
jgi:hypothetical protein